MVEGPTGAPNKSSSSRPKHPSSVRAIVYYVMPGILFMLLTAVLLLNFQHSVKCSGGESHTETSLHRMALDQRLLSLEEQAMENSLLLESFIRKLDAKYRVLSGDTISTFRTQAHEEASQIALHLIEEPTPPMPTFLAAALASDFKALGSQIDAAFVDTAEVKKSEEWGPSSSSGVSSRSSSSYSSSSSSYDSRSSGSQRSSLNSASSSSSSAMKMAQWPQPGGQWPAAVLGSERDSGKITKLDKEPDAWEKEMDMYQKCANLRDSYHVKVGSTWGSLPDYLQPAWRSYDCDYYAALSSPMDIVSRLAPERPPQGGSRGDEIALE